jgi:hypothetical protein
MEQDELMTQARREADILRLAQVNATTTATIVQGLLANRWKRRDGDIYRAAGNRR